MILTKYRVTNTQFINTSEAHSKIAFLGNGNFIVPYIGVCLMPSNPITGKQVIVDYSYYVLEDVRSIRLSTEPNSPLCLKLAHPTASVLLTDYISVGGYNGTPGNEMKIECKELWFYLPSVSKIEKPFPLPFRPYETPGVSSNMNILEIQNFFLLENLPSELIDLLGNEICSFVWDNA